MNINFTLRRDEAENSIMQTISIAVSAILIAAGLVTAPSLINNARDLNAKTDLASISQAQEYRLADSGQYSPNLADLSSPDIKLTLSAKTAPRLTAGTDCYAAFVKSDSGSTFYRTNVSAQSFKVQIPWPSLKPAGYPTGCVWPGSSAEATGNQYTNLFTNPSFESVQAGTTVTRTNLASDPRATTIGNAQGGVYRWSPDWFGRDGTGGTTTITAAVDGPVGIDSYIRKSWTGSPSSIGSQGNSGYSLSRSTGTGAGTDGVAVSPGETYTFSYYMRSSAESKTANAAIYQRDASGTYLYAASGPAVKLSAGEWTRVSWTYTVPVSVSFIGLRADIQANGTLWKPGDTLDGTGLLIELASEVRPYFDGSSPKSLGWDYAWLAAANGSPSVVRSGAASGEPLPSSLGARYGSGVSISYTPVSSGSASLRQYSTVASSGTESMYFPAGGFGSTGIMKAGKTYTVVVKVKVSGSYSVDNANARTVRIRWDGGAAGYAASAQAPNAPGIYELRVTATIPAVATGTMVQFNHYGKTGEPDLFWDDLTIVEGTYAGPAFTGDSPNGGSWDGERHNSPSKWYYEG